MASAEDKAVAARLEMAVKEISGLATQFDVFRFLKRLTEAKDKRAFMVMSRPSEFTQELSSCTLITNWPSELLTQYDHLRPLNDSPVFQRMRSSTLPFHSDLLTEKGGSKQYTALLQRFELTHSLWFPVHDAGGGFGAIGFSGSTPPGDSDIVELSYLSIVLYERLHTIGKRDNQPREVLTERETVCLNWTAAGKTSAEIADILNLSEHTVNHYLNRATRKLDAVNRTQAVAKAIRQNIIK